MLIMCSGESSALCGMAVLLPSQFSEFYWDCKGLFISVELSPTENLTQTDNILQSQSVLLLRSKDVHAFPVCSVIHLLQISLYLTTKSTDKTEISLLHKYRYTCTVLSQNFLTPLTQSPLLFTLKTVFLWALLTAVLLRWHICCMVVLLKCCTMSCWPTAFHK